MLKENRDYTLKELKDLAYKYKHEQGEYTWNRVRGGWVNRERT